MPQTKLIDYPAMVKQFVGDEIIFRRFANRFLDSFEKSLKDIEESFLSGEADTVKASIHAFKNLVCNFHASFMNQIVGEMEKLAAIGALDSAEEKMEDVKVGAGKIAVEIKALLENSDPLNL
ncbi:MAG: hypothetical protein A4S09_13115 [Proteobacteria bacterium SG_bin7]|nr:MAG: hypothetical protein A4S09_13115 [Proteobacteria bacterium SG_bin7]